MEFVDGPPLTSIIEQQGALPPKRAAEIVRQTAEALAVAHDMGIVHRDLKPDNIMVARTRDGGDLVKVVDFGIAKAAGNDAQKVTKTGLVVGTPEYMSPEQLSGDQLDGRSDIYSLGLVAFNMLTGTLPFPSDSAQEAMIMRLTDKPKPLAEMKRDRAWPADVQAVIDRALERDVKLRYQNATDFGMALYNAIQRMPETVVAEAGTTVMGAVPPTRVASIADVPSLTATVAIPTPVMNRTVAQPAPAATPTAGKSKLPVVIGGAAVVVIGAFVALKGGGKSETPVAADTTAKSAAMAAPVKSDSLTQFAKPQGSTIPATPAPAASAPRTLAQLEEDAATASKADGVLSALTSARTTTDDERARVNFIRFKAYTAKEEPDKACLAIKEAVRLAADPVARDRYQQRAEACP
jgi:serine/threonine-protein kinase